MSQPTVFNACLKMSFDIAKIKNLCINALLMLELSDQTIIYKYITVLTAVNGALLIVGITVTMSVDICSLVPSVFL